MKTESDFSTFNFEYLLRARDITRKDSETASVSLGVAPEFCKLLSEIDTTSLIELSKVKQPLVVPCKEEWWWKRLFTALKEGRHDEVTLILEQASVITTKSGGKS